MNSDFCVAVHALVYLRHMDSIVSSTALADNICTNPARVRKVLSPLRKNGIVTTSEGIDGGYRLTEGAGTLTLSELAGFLSVSCVTLSWHSGSIDKECLVSSGMGKVMDGIVDDLNNACMEKLSCITIADIERQIFSNRKQT